MIRLALVLVAACRTPCPAGGVSDPDRAGRLLEPLGEHARVCFVADRPSALLGEVVLLDRALPDDVARARVAHLLHHRGFVAPPGDGCLPAWIAEERAARRVEDGVRADAGLGPLGDDVPADLLDALTARCDHADGGAP